MRFRFEAFDGAGEIVSGDVEAASAEAARALIQARGATPYRIKAALSLGILTREIGRTSTDGRLGDSDVARLARDIGVLLGSGVALDATLRIAAAASEVPRIRTVTERLLDSVLGGASLAEAMAALKPSIRPEYVRIVEAGELRASLAAALDDLADLIDRRVEIRARVRAALAYPALLVCMAGVSLWVVLGLLIPAVTPIFVENGKPLPVVLQTLEAVRTNALPVLVAILVLATILAIAIVQARQSPAAARRIDRAFLMLPIIGRIAEAREAARFTRTLASLVKAGVAPLQALQAACPLVRNAHVRSCLDAAVRDVRAGVGIGAAMTRSSALPVVARQMIMVGEESSRLPDMLFRAAAILERQDQILTARTVTVITPALTILVSGIVGAVILSVMSAILSINDLVVQ